MLPAPCRPTSRQPRVEIRATGSSRPYFDAHHGGAAGYRKYVASPIAHRVMNRRRKAAQRARSRSQNTTATASAVTKCEKYTQLASTSHQWMTSGW